ncbi:MAG: hypothetical protein ABI658_32470 [Acidimicrobiales bacterium]
MADNRDTPRCVTDVEAWPGTSADPLVRDTVPTVQVNEAGLWRGALFGAALGFAFFALVIALGAMASGFAPVSAVGIGAFVGLWGGLGFGMVMGGGFAFHGMSELNEPAMTRQDSGAKIVDEPARLLR